MEPAPLTLGQFIRRARLDRVTKITQQELADLVTEKLGQPFTKNMVTKVEGDNRELSFAEAVAFADSLGVPLNSMADDLYRNSADDILYDAYTLIDKHRFGLLQLGAADVMERLEEVESRLYAIKARSEDDAASRFIAAFDEIVKDLPRADELTLEAEGIYRQATDLLLEIIAPEANEAEPFDLSDVEGYDPETGEFT